MSTKLISPPSPEIVTLADAKLHLRVDHADEDALIGSLITSARLQAEHATGRAFGQQVRELIIDRFPVGEIRLPGTPVTAIDSVTYVDADGVTQTMASAAYVLDDASVPSWLLPASGTDWPENYDTANAVRIRYTCGHVAAEVADVCTWILLHVGNWYRNRESVNVGSTLGTMPYIDGLLDRYRIWSL